MIDIDQKTKHENILEFMSAKQRICEMANSSDINVPIDPRIDIDVITADDPDPKFVNVEVLRAGVISKVNHRRYNNNIVREINTLTPGVQGFFGHPDPSKEGFEFREPQCIFVGSMVDHMPDGLDRCIAKAYLFKTSKLREWIPKSIAAGNPMTVSINATGDVIYGEDIIDVIHVSELLSIDWANPGTEGVETAQALSIVRELQNKEEKDMDGATNMNAQDIIKNVSVAELKAYNQDSYNGILKGVTVAELQAQNPTIVEQIKESGKITEMALKIDRADKNIKLTELQGVIDGLESKVAELNGKIEEARVTELRGRLLGEMVPEQYREKISARISGTTEDEIKKSIDTEISYIREMGGSWDNKPAGRTQDIAGDDLKASIAAMFGHKSAENK